jgi:uncharacterized protein
MRKSFVFLLVVLAFSPALHASDYRYFFYKATKAEVTYYFLGSMHMGKPDDPDYPAKVYTALNGCSMFILEGEVRKEKIRTPNLSVTYLPQGSTMQKLLGPDDAARFAKTAKATGISVSLVDHYQPWFIEFMLGYRMAFNEGFVLEYGTEHRLIRYMKQKMPANRQPRIFALEASDEVLRYMGNLTLPEQLARFRSFLRYSEKTGEGNAVEMQRYWRNGDDQKVLQIFHYYAEENSAAGNRFAQILLYDRNERMAERLGLIAKYPGQYFVVTGALHLIGKQSILEHLKQKGFAIERL